MSEKDKIAVEFNGSLELGDAKALLRNLFESIENGQVVVQKGHEHVVLNLGQVVEVSIAGKRKKGKQSLSFELSWRDAAVKSEGGGFSISSTAPSRDEVETPLSEDVDTSQSTSGAEADNR